MSDLLIKGMEMPRSCDFCPISLPHAEKLGCGFDLEHCPITEVHPHGRLIEKNAVFELILSMPSVGKLLPVEFMKALQEIPTVIPAEEGE